MDTQMGLSDGDYPCDSVRIELVESLPHYGGPDFPRRAHHRLLDETQIVKKPCVAALQIQ